MAHALPIEDILHDIERIPERRVYGRVAHEVPNFVLDAVMTPSKSTSGVDGARLQR